MNHVLFYRRSFLLILLAWLAACTTVPITGRKQLNLIPADQMLALSFSNYQQFLDKHTVIKNTPQTKMVRNVGHKIQRAVEQYFKQQGQSALLKGYQWEFNLVEDQAKNAWCMPGGKVVVYTGILELAPDEAHLAVVMGHEIAHAVAGHGNERMSQALLVQLGGMALDKALKSKPQKTRELFLTAFGITTQVGVMLPFSRLQESEADRLGLIFMALAGYDPHTALDFWQAMARMQQNAVPEWLSTHPSDQHRIRDIKRHLPEALTYYQAQN